MQTRVDVSLNDVSITDVSSLIVLQGVDESAPSWNINAVNRAYLLGQHYVNTEKRYRDIVVKFAIRERRDLAVRASVLDGIMGWAAAGGWLKVNYRPEQKIYVELSAPPAITDINQWANTYQMTFRAYDIPQWVSSVPDTATLTGSGDATITCTSNAGGKLRVSALNSSGSSGSYISLVCGDQQMQISNIVLADGETFVMDYTDNDILRLRVLDTNGDYRSVLSNRTVASVDDIWLSPGSNAITAMSSVDLEWTFSTYGRWH